MDWYPLKLTTNIQKYAFGERLIPERLNKRGLPSGIIAETWEISDYQDKTGTVVNGFLAGRTLHELTLAHPDELVGHGWRGPHFPLLCKFIDASHMLPVHLHADDETALRLHNEPNGKTEAWHILWAAPGATVLAGLKSEFTREQLFTAFASCDYDSVLVRHSIQAGDTIYVPAGVIHSFGPDTLVLEIQQTSNLAQSVMPTDLYGNQYNQQEWYANINATLDELKNHYQPLPNHGLKLQSGANLRIFGCAGPYFALEHWILNESYLEPSHVERCLTLSNVGNVVQLEFASGIESLEQGESCILPAAIGEVRVVPDSQTHLIACYVPDLQRNIIAPLQAAGYEQQQIQKLGEVDSI
ncbi:class I mannose-6-phosphate isomerase [Fortiea contorta]|uniref:class I mannose-6-phosphate isomerase n=1 Tax=Fortiea contorta TaxID=1892405 RepID=UPI00034A2B81|nr:class I mannose-6-phosphate isomerase [Fortiea contorta]